jgi:uncharacterized RDD family membrane protein YckC
VTQHPHAVTRPIAALERRFTAFAVDRLLVWGLLAVVAIATVLLVSDEVWTVVAVVAGAMVLLWLVLAIVLGVSGSSPGKAMRGLRVVHHGDGRPIGVGPALLRSFVLGASGLPTFGIGLATLAWTAVEDRGHQRRGWHDHLTGTVVVDVRPAVEVADGEADAAPRHIVNLTAMRLVPAPPVEAVRTPVPAQQAPRPAVRTPAPPRWRVHFDDGDTFVIGGLVLVGRRPEARDGEQVAHLVPLSSADMSVSKTHAQFGPAPDGTIVVMDRGSTNGTVLVRQGVSRQLAPGRPAALVHGDKVVYGDREMTISREA